MALNLQLSSAPGFGDFPFINLTNADIPAGRYVKIDTAHQISASNQTQQGLAIMPIATDGDVAIGITMEKAVSLGPAIRVRTLGMAVTVADGSITGGTYVMASGGTNKGYAKAAASADSGAGIAMTTAADGEDVLVLVMVGAKNA